MIILTDLIALLQKKGFFLLVLFLPTMFYAQGTFNYQYDRYDASGGMPCARADYLSCKGVKLYDIKLADINNEKVDYDTIPWKFIFPNWMRSADWKPTPNCGFRKIPRPLIVWQKIPEVPYINGRMVYECDGRIIPVSNENIYSMIPLDTSVKNWQRILLDQMFLKFQQVLDPPKVQAFVQSKAEVYTMPKKRELRKGKYTHLLIGDEDELLKIDSLLEVDYYSYLENVGVSDSVGTELRSHWPHMMVYFNEDKVAYYNQKDVWKNGELIARRVLWLGGPDYNSIGVTYKVTQSGEIQVLDKHVLSFSTVS